MTVLPAEAFGPLAVPTGLVGLPSRPMMFVGRDAELALLDEAMAGPSRVVVQAVHGLGGIGKSTLAAHWAAARADQHILTWWITADTRAAVEAGLAALAVALQPALSGVLPMEALRERAVQWLAAHEQWLLILDNVTDPADIAALLASADGGRFLITSRRATGWHNLATPVRLDVLDRAEAVDLLTRIVSQAGQADCTGAAELCAELGCLPLAVEQAAAYISETGTSLREYLDLLAEYPAAIYRAAAEGGDAARTIARIWHVTLDRLADEPLTGQVLRILAWYAPDSIPRSVLDGLADPVALIGAVGRLAAYSMLTADASTGVLAVHRLVQAVTRTPDCGDPHRGPQAISDACAQATRQLVAALPGRNDPAEWAAWRTLIPHIDALTSHTSQAADTDGTASLLSLAGAFLDGQGQVTRAIAYLQRALADRRRILGDDHPDTLTCGHNLAKAYESAGDLGRAVPLFEQTLADLTRVLGSDHPDTLASRNNLAHAYRQAGSLRRATALYQQALSDTERVLGSDHPHVLASRQNLALSYQWAGDLGGAIPLHEQNLTDTEQVLGSDHPLTLGARYSLASAYQEAGDLSRAIPLYQQALADRQRVLGGDHPDTLISRNNLASAYQAAGDPNRAIPLHEQILADQQRVLGDDHPDALTSRMDLASAYQAAGDLSRAIPLIEQTMTDTRRVLGSDHPLAMAAGHHLADAYREAGNLSRAIPLYQQALADMTRVLGGDHPYTLAACHHLAFAYQEAGDLSRAIPLYQQALADRQRVLGGDHPDTLISRNNLASAYQAAGDPNRAIPLHEQILADRQRVLGDDHPSTLGSRNNLASAYQAAGDLSRAIPMFEQTFADMTRILGSDHPSTLVSRNNLASSYQEAGDLNRAISLFEQTLADSARVLGSDHPKTNFARENLAIARQQRHSGRYGSGSVSASPPRQQTVPNTCPDHRLQQRPGRSGASPDGS
jgi:tetratricopeptide (TPR) repeat protein